MTLNPLVHAARHGPWVMVGGLVAGLALPGLAAPMLPFLPWLVGLLLFLAAFRTEPAGLRAGLRNLPGALAAVGVLQVAVPLVVVGLGHALGVAETPLLLALIVMTSAPAISGSPNMALMLGHSPAPALRLLILGTLLLPLTVLPVFLLVPGLGGFGNVVEAVGRLLLIILGTATAGVMLRRIVLPVPGPRTREMLDGLSALALAVFVVALMPSVSAAFLDAPLIALGWLAAAFAANFGMQIAAHGLLGGRARPETAVGLSLAAGNRNIALFLVALPLDITAPIVIFIGCYQIPMYLTPLVMRRLYPRP